MNMRYTQLRSSTTTKMLLMHTLRRVLKCKWSLVVAATLIVMVTIWGTDTAGKMENLRLYRDVLDQEAWPEVEEGYTRPGQTPEVLGVVHYVWCGSKEFRFQDYLGVLSAVRILQPAKLVFHYTYLPQVDAHWYHTWFQELKQSVPNLVLHLLPVHTGCGSREILQTALTLLAHDGGGIFLGENVLLTRFPVRQEELSRPFWFAFSDTSRDVARGVIVAPSGFDDARKEELILEMQSSGPRCGTIEEYNKDGTFSDFACISVIGRLYPRDIWDADTPFAELARWLYYGQRSARRVESENGEPIPRISHYVWLKSNGIFASNEFKFLHFLSVLSALHVAGMQHVYVHGDAEPEGRWWERLRRENVSFVKIDRPETVFQQAVRVPAHKSDILRVGILDKYGGVYQDRDVLWTSRVPDRLLEYPTVATLDFPANGEWPETFNLGVLMSRRRAPWLRHFLSTLRYYRDNHWGFNACFMSYRAYEWAPETLFVDRRGQVICFEGICHPTWHSDYKRDPEDRSPVKPFHWREGRAVHFVRSPLPSLQSLETVVAGTDMYAELGRHILKESGRGY